MFLGHSKELAELGITRIADLTDLDRIGLPVWAAYRPNARSISVSQGKGMSPDHARLTAIMEAVETALAEDCERLDTVVATAARMQASGRRITPLQLMAKCQDPAAASRGERVWVQGQSRTTRQPVWAPFELVGLDWRSDSPWDHEAFRMSSVGLAVHFSRDSAILNGLLEVIEYDAVALAFSWPGILDQLPRLDPEVSSDPDLSAALGRVRAAGYRARFVDLTSDIGIPVALCILDGCLPGQDRQRAAPFVGHASRLDIGSAMLQALLEAAQTQITDISGARDDILADDYELTGWTGQEAPPDDLIPAPHAPTMNLAEGLSTGGQIDFIEKRLHACGIDDIFVFDLAGEQFGISCVSVICPQLELGSRQRGFRPGARARMRALQFAMCAK